MPYYPQGKALDDAGCIFVFQAHWKILNLRLRAASKMKKPYLVEVGLFVFLDI